MSPVSRLALSVVLGAIASVTSVTSHAADDVRVQIRDVAVKHVIVTTPKKYADVREFIETKLGRFDQSMRDMLKNGQVDQLRDSATRIIQNYGLSIHYIAYHGKLLALNGPTRNLVAYYIGDLLSASKMTRVVPAAGLYAPLRVVVYENDSGGTTIEYDQPSTLFGQFRNPTTTEMGVNLDGRMDKLIHDAAS
ncbi:DUF302 domain-containing protein [Paraburkholderia sp. ZP32-5]|uniref:DUF302 domain-containing protein n=1 Tax=Paraburkholderia sp. ZP32-5 TaxID=2883245 RepID=UPI001F2B181F|nr:DUF302 domain-containing protein [Paraburkholderia sp. ZP32-5]